MAVKNIKKNNTGMSLVELLVAVAIFVAAIVPMLYAFVYSTGFNFKAQRYMQSTGISQAIIEKCKGANVDATDISNMLADGSILSGTQFTVGGTDASAAPVYWINSVTATNGIGDAVDGGNATRRTYDVKVTFQPIPVSATDTSSIQSMSSTTANFCDEYISYLTTADSHAQHEIVDKLKALFVDDNIYNTSGTRMTTIPGTAGIASTFGPNFENHILANRIVIDRVITITARDIGVNIKVEYYFGGFNNIRDDGHHVYFLNGNIDTQEFVSDDISYTVGGTSYNINCKCQISDAISAGLISDYYRSSGSPFYVADINSDGTLDTDGFYILGDATDSSLQKAPSAVYFYFYPGYSTTDANICSFHDYFVLNNDMSTSFVDPSTGLGIERLDFYLFKQYNDSFSSSYPYGDYINDFDSKYTPDITMGDAAFDTYLHHNFLYNVEAEDNDNTSLTNFANPSVYSSMIHLGVACHNDTIVLPDNTYANDFRNSLNTLPAEQYMNSPILADDAILPYRHEDRSSSTVNMYVARYDITVEVFPHDGSDHSGATPVESMTSEVLNW